jgi:hypothetical protein
MDEKFKNLDETNNKKVKLMAEQMINRFMNTFKLDQLVSIDAVDTTTFK